MVADTDHGALVGIGGDARRQKRESMKTAHWKQYPTECPNGHDLLEHKIPSGFATLYDGTHYSSAQMMIASLHVRSPYAERFGIVPAASCWRCPHCETRWEDAASRQHFAGVPRRGRLADELFVVVE